MMQESKDDVVVSAYTATMQADYQHLQDQFNPTNIELYTYLLSQEVFTWEAIYGYVLPRPFDDERVYVVQVGSILHRAFLKCIQAPMAPLNKRCVPHPQFCWLLSDELVTVLDDVYQQRTRKSPAPRVPSPTAICRIF